MSLELHEGSKTIQVGYLEEEATPGIRIIVMPGDILSFIQVLSLKQGAISGVGNGAWNKFKRCEVIHQHTLLGAVVTLDRSNEKVFVKLIRGLRVDDVNSENACTIRCTVKDHAIISYCLSQFGTWLKRALDVVTLLMT